MSGPLPPSLPLALLLAFACRAPEPPRTSTPTDAPPEPPTTGDTATGPGNVLLVVLDDVGVDKIGAYGAHPVPVATPVIDGLAARGVRFRNAWAEPLCSPTRAALLTGRHVRRTGIGTSIDWSLGNVALSRDELLIPEVLAAAGAPHESGAIGKWHLSIAHQPDGALDPNLQGFDHFSGHLGQLVAKMLPDAEAHSYFRWDRDRDGVYDRVERYATTVQIDDAIAWIWGRPGPWFLYLALSAPHEPWDVPPASLDGAGVQPTDPDFDRYAAVLRAADRELGRLLDALGPEELARTTVIVVGDNGSPPETVLPPWDPTHGKGDLSEGGLRVPLIAAGPAVAAAGAESAALVHVVDLLPTVAELAGVSLDGLPGASGAPLVLDGASLVPLLADPDAPWDRQTVYSERMSPAGPPPYRDDLRAIRDDRFKLVVDATGVSPPQLFELPPDGFVEGPNLLDGSPLAPDAGAALDRLRDALEAQVAAMPYEGPPRP